SLEYLRRPIYRIVDGVSISAHGAVYSVIVAHRGELARTQEIKLDPASETSVALLRCLLAQRDLNPRLVSWHRDLADEPAEDHRQDAKTTAHLLIGDHAIRFRTEQGEYYRYWDLAETWTQITSLPFVFAFWCIRPEIENAKEIADKLRAPRGPYLARIAAPSPS